MASLFCLLQPSSQHVHLAAHAAKPLDLLRVGVGILKRFLQLPSFGFEGRCVLSRRP